MRQKAWGKQVPKILQVVAMRHTLLTETIAFQVDLIQEKERDLVMEVQEEQSVKVKTRWWKTLGLQLS